MFRIKKCFFNFMISNEVEDLRFGGESHCRNKGETKPQRRESNRFVSKTVGATLRKGLPFIFPKGCVRLDAIGGTVISCHVIARFESSTLRGLSCDFVRMGAAFLKLPRNRSLEANCNKIMSNLFTNIVVNK